ncbi:hypothetical protein [Methylomagnum sp.]
MTVTLTAMHRPDYLRQTLTHLQAVRGIGGWHLYIGLEPGAEECARLCEGVDFMPCTILRNPERLGIRGNPYHVMRHAFGQGSRLNIHLEDDVLLSPDVAELALWYDRAVEGDVLIDVRIMLLNLFVTSTHDSHRGDLNISQFFSPWGMVMNAWQWRHWIEPAWWNDDHRYPGMRDWTLSLSEQLHRNKGLFVLAPLLSRSTNIGREGGVHSHPERHDLFLGGLRWNNSPNPIEYHINPARKINWRQLDYKNMRVMDN